MTDPTRDPLRQARAMRAQADYAMWDAVIGWGWVAVLLVVLTLAAVR
jgi:hypothetical protein